MSRRKARKEEGAGDKKAIEQLYVKCKDYFEAYYFTYVVKDRYTSKYDRFLLKDLHSELYLYMIKAVERYKKEKKISFMSYLTFYFLILLNDRKKYLQEIVHIPANLKLCGIYNEEINEDIFQMQSVKNEGEINIQNEENTFVLESKLKCLNRTERTVILLKYKVVDTLEKGTANEIAAYLFENGITNHKLTQERIRQIIKKAENKLGIIREKKTKDQNYHRNYYKQNREIILQRKKNKKI